MGRQLSEWPVSGRAEGHLQRERQLQPGPSCEAPQTACPMQTAHVRFGRWKPGFRGGRTGVGARRPPGARGRAASPSTLGRSARGSPPAPVIPSHPRGCMASCLAHTAYIPFRGDLMGVR